MKVIDHGWWRKYKPDKLREGVPSNVIHLRRESDGVDWYDYRRPNDPNYKTYKDVDPDAKPNFVTNSVLLNVYYHEHFAVYLVGTAVRDPSMVLPSEQQVIEVLDYQGGDDLHAEFGGKQYDPVEKTFAKYTRPPMPLSPVEQKIMGALDAIMERLSKLESK